jgi:acyl CoA:acetate/3-ketoacid CoA transferase
MRIEDGRLVIDREGRIPKFVEKVDQVSFSGRRARAQNQEIHYVTERCVVRLDADGLRVVEIAPGIDLERDVLAQAATPLKVADDLRLMDGALFREEPMGLRL